MSNVNGSESESNDDIKKLKTVFKAVDEVIPDGLSSTQDDSDEDVSIDIDIRSVVTTTSAGEQKLVEIKNVEQLGQGKRAASFAKRTESEAAGNKRQSKADKKPEITYNSPLTVESVRVGSFLTESKGEGEDRSPKPGQEMKSKDKSTGQLPKEPEKGEENVLEQLSEQQQNGIEQLSQQQENGKEQQEQQPENGMEQQPEQQETGMEQQPEQQETGMEQQPQQQDNAMKELSQQQEKSKADGMEQLAQEQEKSKSKNINEPPKPQKGKNEVRTKTTTTLIEGTVEIKGKIRCTSPVKEAQSPSEEEEEGNIELDFEGRTFTMHVDKNKKEDAKAFGKPVPNARTSKAVSDERMDMLNQSINEEAQTSAKSVHKYGALDTEIDTNLEQSLPLHSSSSHDQEQPLSEPSPYRVNASNVEKVHKEVDVGSNANGRVENVHSEVDVTYEKTGGTKSKTKPAADLTSKKSEKKLAESGQKQVTSSVRGKEQKATGVSSSKKGQNAQKYIDSLKILTSKINIRVAEIMALNHLRETMQRKASKREKPGQPDEKRVSKAVVNKERAILDEIDKKFGDIHSKFN